MSWQTLPDPSSAIEPFEQAVVAAASLYFYAVHQNLSVRLWTAGTGLVQGSQAVLETLAAVQAGEDVRAEQLPDSSLLWLTQNPVGLTTLPPGSRWLLWTTAQLEPTVASSPGILIQPDQPLQLQLQRTLEKQLQAE
jgi:uncharacterized protein (DUF58 family)